MMYQRLLNDDGRGGLPYSGRREDDRLLIRRRPRCLAIVGQTGVVDIEDYEDRRMWMN
jgi:hypothetical protein